MQKVNTTEQPETPAPTALSDKELQDARQLINIFILAWKNYGLYPEDHVNTIKSFERLVAAFGDFFMTHVDLRLTVEKAHLLCESEVIYKVSQEAPSEDIITLLYRDGIKWIAFQEGLTLDEIASFFKIINKYRSLTGEAEGDIVTALMDEELEYIDFKAVDIFWQDLLLIDVSQLPTPAPLPEEVDKKNETDPSQQPEGQDRKDIYARSIADPSISNAQLKLTNADYKILQQMVREEESWDITDDLFEALLIILKSQSEQEKFATVLGFMSEVVVETIELDKFDLLVKFFQSLRKLFSPEISAEQDWKRRLVDRFFKDLSRPELFQLISKKLLKLQTSETEKLNALDQALHYFSPEVIPFLVPIIIQKNSHEIQQMILEVIVHLSQRDIGPLEKVAEQHGEEMGDNLLAILNRLQGEQVNTMLFKMCDHSSDIVRRKAIKELLNRNPKYSQQLFSLIDDPNKAICSYILAAIGKHKSITLESKLLNYLKENATKKDPGHILACYEALGRCGSNNVVPFMSDILLSRGWNSFMGSGKLFFRECAAIALAWLGSPEAKEVLQKASKSRFKVIRKALDRTKSICAVAGENTND